MAAEVKPPTGAGKRPKSSARRTRISSKHQVTIPIDAFNDAGFKTGDTVQAEAIGPGQVVLTRQDALLDKFSGMLHTGGKLGKTIERLRREWE